MKTSCWRKAHSIIEEPWSSSMLFFGLLSGSSELTLQNLPLWVALDFYLLRDLCGYECEYQRVWECRLCICINVFVYLLSLFPFTQVCILLSQCIPRGSKRARHGSLKHARTCPESLALKPESKAARVK